MVALRHILAYFRYDTYFIKDKHTFFFLFFIIFGVREVSSYLNFLGNISIGSELPVSISKGPVPSATLAYHLELAFQKPKTACFFILNGNTVVFIPDSKLCFVDRQPSPWPDWGICCPL